MAQVFYCSECGTEERRNEEDRLGENVCPDCETPMTAIAGN